MEDHCSKAICSFSDKKWLYDFEQAKEVCQSGRYLQLLAHFEHWYYRSDVNHLYATSNCKPLLVIKCKWQYINVATF